MSLFVTIFNLKNRKYSSFLTVIPEQKVTVKNGKVSPDKIELVIK